MSVFDAIPEAPSTHQGNLRLPKKNESIPSDAFFWANNPTSTIANK